MFAAIVKADPTFGPIWDAFRTRWRADAELPMHVAATALARHLIAKLAAKETAAFPAVFAIVEEWLSHPDRYIRRVADVGLIEELQGTRLHKETKPGDFHPWLGPKAKAAWSRVGASWLKLDEKEDAS
jgi:hypothetical protein